MGKSSSKDSNREFPQNFACSSLMLPSSFFFTRSCLPVMCFLFLLLRAHSWVPSLTLTHFFSDQHHLPDFPWPILFWEFLFISLPLILFQQVHLKFLQKFSPNFLNRKFPQSFLPYLDRVGSQVFANIFWSRLYIFWNLS